MKFVVTGGPGSGKDTTIDELRRRGYTTVDEAAMPIKEEQQRRKAAGLPYTLPENDNSGFQRLIYTHQLALEEAAKRATHQDDAIFVNRGLIDNIGYCRRFGTPISVELHGLCARADYAGVFILAPLPQHLYRNEIARDEPYEESLRLGALMEEAYRDYGHAPVSVPFFRGTKEESVRMRAEHILDMVAQWYASRRSTASQP